jgi:NAD(P)H-hydrate repair Nnr-like enzyme with NAD(P)H-hydrate dehydratase domain
MASLRAGADLAHVFCTPDAGQVIKTYSPDLIVHTVFRPPPSSPSSSSKAQEDDGLPSEEELEKLLGRLHALVIGPGLGRDDFMQAAGKRALKVARKLGLWVVLDAECVSSVSLPLPVWFSRAPRADFRLSSREPCFPNLTCSFKARNWPITLFDEPSATPQRPLRRHPGPVDCRRLRARRPDAQRDGVQVSMREEGAWLARSARWTPPTAILTFFLVWWLALATQGIDPKSTDAKELCPALAKALGHVTVVQKGATDLISNGHLLTFSSSAASSDGGEGGEKKRETTLECAEEGGLKRCGGQGDVLSGTTGLMLAWAGLWSEGTYE